MVAGLVSMASNNDALLLRQTTSMPNQHGLGALLAMIFAPCVEMRVDPKADRYEERKKRTRADRSINNNLSCFQIYWCTHRAWIPGKRLGQSHETWPKQTRSETATGQRSWTRRWGLRGGASWRTGWGWGIQGARLLFPPARHGDLVRRRGQELRRGIDQHGSFNMAASAREVFLNVMPRILSDPLLH